MKKIDLWTNNRGLFRRLEVCLQCNGENFKQFIRLFVLFVMTIKFK